MGLDKAVQEAAQKVEKAFGDGSVIGLGDRVGKPVPCIPTGIWAVDYDVLGIGGLPRGRMVEMFGTESSGKTTLALTAVAQAQAAGGHAAFIDVEHALDPSWMSRLGCDVDKVLVSQPDYGEQALEITQQLIAENIFDIIVVDSVAALVPKAELDGDMGDSHMGLQARMMSQAMRKLTPVLSGSKTVLVWINQIRDKIGVMFGSPETTTGGRALKFYASIRLDVRRIGGIKVGDEMVGNKVRVKATKNKMSAPFREAEVELLFGNGFDAAGSVFDAAVEAGLVEKSGSWFSYKGERLGQGRVNAISAVNVKELRESLLCKT